MSDKRAVGFLDVLGFKNLIETMPLEALAGKYEALVEQVRALLRPQSVNDHPTLFPNRGVGHQWCIQSIFSDSIILVANEDTDEACLELLVYAWRLSQLFLAAGMPLRGALHYDEMHVNETVGVFLGKALSGAYKAEMQQDWIGVCVNDSLEGRYKSLFVQCQNQESMLFDLFRRYPVPLKDGTAKEMHTLNWRYNYVVEKGTRSLFPPTTELAVRRKQQNTLAYAKAVVDSGRIYSQDQGKAPVELRAFFVGERFPPFPHGDDL